MKRLLILGWFFFIPWSSDTIGPFGSHSLCDNVMKWMVEAGFFNERPNGCVEIQAA